MRWFWNEKKREFVTEDPKAPSLLSPSAWSVLSSVWENTMMVQSNTAREYAEEVGLLASLGLISTVDPDGSHYGRTWRVTKHGLMALTDKGLVL